MKHLISWSVSLLIASAGGAAMAQLGPDQDARARAAYAYVSSYGSLDKDCQPKGLSASISETMNSWKFWQQQVTELQLYWNRYAQMRLVGEIEGQQAATNAQYEEWKARAMGVYL